MTVLFWLLAALMIVKGCVLAYLGWNPRQFGISLTFGDTLLVLGTIVASAGVLTGAVAAVLGRLSTMADALELFARASGGARAVDPPRDSTASAPAPAPDLAPPAFAPPAIPEPPARSEPSGPSLAPIVAATTGVAAVAGAAVLAGKVAASPIAATPASETKPAPAAEASPPAEEPLAPVAAQVIEAPAAPIMAESVAPEIVVEAPASSGWFGRFRGRRAAQPAQELETSSAEMVTAPAEPTTEPVVAELVVVDAVVPEAAAPESTNSASDPLVDAIAKALTGPMVATSRLEVMPAVPAADNLADEIERLLRASEAAPEMSLTAQAPAPPVEGAGDIELDLTKALEAELASLVEPAPAGSAEPAIDLAALAADLAAPLAAPSAASSPAPMAALARDFPELGDILSAPTGASPSAPAPTPMADGPLPVLPPITAPLLREGTIAGIPFKLYGDGSIEADIAGQPSRFASLRAFRSYVGG